MLANTLATTLAVVVTLESTVTSPPAVMMLLPSMEVSATPVALPEAAANRIFLKKSFPCLANEFTPNSATLPIILIASTEASETAVEVIFIFLLLVMVELLTVM